MFKWLSEGLDFIATSLLLSPISILTSLSKHNLIPRCLPELGLPIVKCEGMSI